MFEVAYNDVNGGSLRLYVCHKDARRITDSVVFALKTEEEFFADPRNSMREFSQRIRELQRRTTQFLTFANSSRKRVYAIGASTKGNTYLQAFKITPDMIKAIGEVSSDKIGKFTLGSDIKIMSEESVLERNPDYLLILPYHFREFFIKRFSSYIENGGTLIFPLPSLTFVSEKGADEE